MRRSSRSESTRCSKSLPRSGRPGAERVEHPDLDVRIAGQQREIEVPSRRVQIVDEQTHAHAAPCSQRGAAAERPPSYRPDVVVLQVERALHGRRERRAGEKRFVSVVEQMEARLAGVAASWRAYSRPSGVSSACSEACDATSGTWRGGEAQPHASAASVAAHSSVPSLRSRQRAVVMLSAGIRRKGARMQSRTIARY